MLRFRILLPMLALFLIASFAIWIIGIKQQLAERKAWQEEQTRTAVHLFERIKKDMRFKEVTDILGFYHDKASVDACIWTYGRTLIVIEFRAGSVWQMKIDPYWPPHD